MRFFVVVKPFPLDWDAQRKKISENGSHCPQEMTTFSIIVITAHSCTMRHLMCLYACWIFLSLEILMSLLLLLLLVGVFFSLSSFSYDCLCKVACSWSYSVAQFTSKLWTVTLWSYTVIMFFNLFYCFVFAIAVTTASSAELYAWDDFIFFFRML